MNPVKSHFLTFFAFLRRVPREGKTGSVGGLQHRNHKNGSVLGKQKNEDEEPTPSVRFRPISSIFLLGWSSKWSRNCYLWTPYLASVTGFFGPQQSPRAASHQSHAICDVVAISTQGSGTSSDICGRGFVLRAVAGRRKRVRSLA